jgi:hypothetical protein
MIRRPRTKVGGRKARREAFGEYLEKLHASCAIIALHRSTDP